MSNYAAELAQINDAHRALTKKFAAKETLPSDGFFDQAAEPMQHARFWLLLASRS
jgi:hypothetical protein